MHARTRTHTHTHTQTHTHTHTRTHTHTHAHTHTPVAIPSKSPRTLTGFLSSAGIGGMNLGGSYMGRSVKITHILANIIAEKRDK